MEEEHVCCVCGKKFTGKGYDPDPIKSLNDGVCCKECYETTVMTAQIEKIIDSWL